VFRRDTAARSFVVKTVADLEEALSAPNDALIFIESIMDPFDAPTELIRGSEDRRLGLSGDPVSVADGLCVHLGQLFTRTYERQEDMWLPILFAPTAASQAAGRAYVERIVARADRDTPVSGQSITAQRAALAAYGAAKDPSYAHIKGLRLPVLVVNGSNDIVIPTINSYILQQFLPSAELILYPDANHGSHFQYPQLFTRHARIFLDD
jgi:pimeloyl-ACP methyl ester carboxylesterase